MHGWDGMGGHWMWGLGGAISMILFWAIIIIAIVALVRWTSDHGRVTASGPRLPEETPLDILKKRYARGEIDRAEFEEKRKDLQ